MRHDRVVQAISSLLKCAGFSYIANPEPTYPINNSGEDIRGDILVFQHNLPIDSTPEIKSSLTSLMVDVTIESPLTDLLCMVRHATALYGHNSKVSMHGALCD